MKSHRGYLVWIVASGLMAGIVSLLFIGIPLPTIIPCTDPIAQDLVLAMCMSLIFQVVIMRRCLPINFGPALAVFLLIMLSILWIGSYPFSPLGFSSGHIPVLRGFIVTRSVRQPIPLQTGDIVTIESRSITDIRSITLPVEESCHWTSMNGGEFDDPTNCEVAYRAPGAADHDVLKLLVQPSCKLPDAHGEIRVSILP